MTNSNNTLTEIWKDYQGNYQVSNLGRVWSHHKNGFINPYLSSSGYRRFKVRANGSEKDMAVHRIVASLFIPNPEFKQYVNHLDGNKTNNADSNLAWVTASENAKHSYEIGTSTPLYGEKNGNAKFKNKDVSKIKNAQKQLIEKYAKQYNVTPRTITRILKKEYWKNVQ